MSRVFVAKKECGHIVAAFPVRMEQNCKAEILKQFTKAGYDIEQASESEVAFMFALTCDCNKPPLLKLADELASADKEAESEELSQEEINEDGGVDMEDVDALANPDEDSGAFEPEEEIEPPMIGSLIQENAAGYPEQTEKA